MADGGFVVTGARPPSALSNHRPSSATRYGYHILARKSSVDESLFRSQHPSRLNETIINFKAPWEYPKPEPPPQTFGATKPKTETKSKPQGRPLLWCPTPGTVTHTREKLKTKSSLDDTNYLWSTRDHFRHLKHTPSFVDESLFGPRLEEPSFKAPWNIRKNEGNRNSKFYALETSALPTPQTGLVNESGIPVKRPVTALGISRSKGKLGCVTEETKPVWKP